MWNKSIPGGQDCNHLSLLLYLWPSDEAFSAASSSRSHGLRSQISRHSRLPATTTGPGEAGELAQAERG